MAAAGAVQVTLVAGFLGAGKTTAIRHWLGQRPPGERWAVLVNDFGLLAIDAAAFDDVAVFEVAGGCACCAAAVAMRATLGRILRQGPWDRILVELSGLGHPAILVDRLREAARGMPLNLEAVIAVVDAGRPGPWLDPDPDPDPRTDPVALGAGLARAQAEAADVVVLSRVPVSTHAPRLRELLAAGVFGPRPVLAGGPELPAWQRVLDALADPAPRVRVASSAHGMPAAAPDATGASAAGVEPLAPPTVLARGGRRWIRAHPEGVELAWQWPADAGFDRRAAIAWARKAAAAGTLLRGKGVFATRRDWYLWQHAAGQDDWAPTGWRRDTRIACLYEVAPSPGVLGTLEGALLAALDPERAGTGA